MRRVLVLGAATGAERDRHGDLQEFGVDGSLRAKLEDAAECVGLGGS